MKYLISSAIALLYSLKHFKELNIRSNEAIRYFKKSLNLSLCYVDFLDDIAIRNASKAGEAAFLCCAYDVVTDWRNFDTQHFFIFKRILYSIVEDNIAEIALDLYKKEKNGLLCDDGLERGEVALRFVTLLTKTEGIFKERTDFAKLGRILQIGDDVLDYEEDIINNDLNCLLSERKCDYLKLLINEISTNEINRLFPKGNVIRTVLLKTRKKALRILNEEKWVNVLE